MVINCTGSLALNLRGSLRVAGVDNTSNVYNRQRLEAGSTTVATDNSTTTYWDDMGRAATVLRTFIGDIFSPFLVTPTIAIVSFTGGSSGAQFTGFTGNHSGNTSFDSINFTCSSGNITGTASMYGYAK